MVDSGYADQGNRWFMVLIFPLSFLKQKNPGDAAKILKDSHWSYSVHEALIKKFYAMTESN